MPEMQVKTLFISNRDDASVSYLIEKFTERCDRYLRIDSEDISLLNFRIDPEGHSLCCDQTQEYSLNKVHSILFKRIPSKYDNPPGDENAPYLNNERKHFLEGLYLSLDKAKWINPMFATHIAERKLYQLKVASNIGLRIPKSLITNNLTQAMEFLRGNKRSIIKPVSNGLQVIGERAYSIYTTEVDADHFGKLGLSDVFSTPVFLQARIPNKHDLRVTIVAETVFAVRISKIGNEVDWRKPEIEKKYEPVTLPQALIGRLHRLMAHLGMVYAAIDLIETPDGDYIFLEINPVGEWAWLEHELGLNISEKIIDQLLL